MTIDQLEDWLPRLAAISPDQRTALPGVTPERTYQIVGGGLVIDEIMKALDVKEVEICHGRCGKGLFCAGSTADVRAHCHLSHPAGVLDKDEIAWLNDYHRQVFAKLAPHLNDEERSWLAEKCAAIGC